jgi:membrane protein YqaA with SNARE-associated domain
MMGPITAALMAVSGHNLRRWFIHLGGVGLIPLGVLDASLLPIPGSIDLVTIFLCIRQPSWWLYYALMATTGSVFGEFITYRLARKGGQKTLERRLRRRRMEKIKRIFNRWGFSALVIPALAPPPVPLVVFVVAAGAAQYPAKKFLAAVALGRVVRYTILAFLAERYGHDIIRLIEQNEHTVTIAAILLGVLVAGTIAFFVWRGRKQQQDHNRRHRTAN